MLRIKSNVNLENLTAYGYELLNGEEWVKYDIVPIDKDFNACFRAVRIANTDMLGIAKGTIVMSHEGIVEHKGLIFELDTSFSLIQDLIQANLVEEIK